MTGATPEENPKWHLLSVVLNEINTANKCGNVVECFTIYVLLCNCILIKHVQFLITLVNKNILQIF